MAKKKPIKSPVCMHCTRVSRKVTGRVVHPHRGDLANLLYYRCAHCDAHVGCHKRGGRPLGRPANSELRKLRSETHRVFDPLWKNAVFGPSYQGSKMDNDAVNKITGSARSRCYAFLAHQLKLSRQDCHIGLFNEQQCRHATAISRKVTYEQIRSWYKKKFPKPDPSGPFDELNKLK